MTKKLGSLIQDGRAVTPVLSHLLLTVVAVAAMALATTAAFIITTDMRETMSERIIIEDVWFNNSTNNIQVYLLNIGKVAVHVSGVYINHTSQHYMKPFDLEIHEHKWLNISQSWASNCVYFVDIVTTRGAHVGGYYETS